MSLAYQLPILMPILEINEKEHELLQQISKSQKLSVRLVKRATLLCSFHLHKRYSETSSSLQVSINFARQWVSTWNKTALIRQNLYSAYIQGELKEFEYRKELLSILSDKPRSGSPRKFTESERSQIVALALQNPSDLDLPFTHWSQELLKTEVIKRNIVASISQRQICRILKKSAFISS